MQQKDIEKLQKVLDFYKAGISNTPSVSYHTTMPAKRLIEDGLVRESTITKDTKTTTTRKQTDKEAVQNLHKVLNAF
jgi:CCR4-NOT transcriptional regulation complex NOT5 subunit